MALPGGLPRAYRRTSLTDSAATYMVTPSQPKTAGSSGWKPAATSCSSSRSRWKSTGTNTTPVGPCGTRIPASASRSSFHAWVAGWSTSKTRTPGSGLR